MRAILPFALLTTLLLFGSCADQVETNSVDTVDAEFSDEFVGEILQTLISQLLELRQNIEKQILEAKTGVRTALLLTIDRSLRRSQTIIISLTNTWQRYRRAALNQQNKRTTVLLEKLEQWVGNVQEALLGDQVPPNIVDEYKQLFREILRLQQLSLEQCRTATEAAVEQFETQLATLLNKYANLLQTVNESIRNCLDDKMTCPNKILEKANDIKELNRELKQFLRTHLEAETQGECVRQIARRLKYAKREVQKSLTELIERLIEEDKRAGTTDPSADIDNSDSDGGDGGASSNSSNSNDSDTADTVIDELDVIINKILLSDNSGEDSSAED